MDLQPLLKVWQVSRQDFYGLGLFTAEADMLAIRVRDASGSEAHIVGDHNSIL